MYEGSHVPRDQLRMCGRRCEAVSGVRLETPEPWLAITCQVTRVTLASLRMGSVRPQADWEEGQLVPPDESSEAPFAMEVKQLGQLGLALVKV